jgi:hypothetical protein
MKCKNCACFDKRSNTCKVFLELQDNCRVYTQDTEYIKKIDKLTEQYAGYLKICQHKDAVKKISKTLAKGDKNC